MKIQLQLTACNWYLSMQIIQIMELQFNINNHNFTLTFNRISYGRSLILRLMSTLLLFIILGKG